MHRLFRLPFLILAIALLDACASGSRVVLLPSGVGAQSSAVVLRSKATGSETITTLDQPYQTATNIGDDFSVRPISKEEFDQDFGSALALMPPKPVSFTFHFPEGSSELTPASREQLTILRQVISTWPAAEIMIVGHTDTVGDMDYNDALSLDRAIAMRNILEAEGFENLAHMEVAGRGKREPLVATDDNVSEYHNRRVVVTIR